MIFNAAAYYALFLLPAAVLFRVVPAVARPWVCAASGLAFYVYFSLTAHGGWAGAACVLLFVWEAAFRTLYAPGRWWASAAGVCASLCVLGAFKYWNFAVGLAGPAAGGLVWAGAFLPLGVSFFTFEFIHYAADRHAGKCERGTPGEYLAFIFFFPTMVAGPIKRFQDFAPCLRDPSRDWPLDWSRGVTRVLTGLVKKFAGADLITSLSDHLNAADIVAAERWVLPVWLFAYGWKIYLDFSAYSDIAIGSARLFGVRVPENFDWPYLATSPADFWRRWHMSLTRWLTDYVFIPLGGSRGSQLLACRNVLIVMLVSGLWHGAGLNFVAWGVWHGLLLVGHRLWVGRRGERGAEPASVVRRVGGWAFTYTAVNVGWAFFAMDLPTAVVFFRRLLFG